MCEGCGQPNHYKNMRMDHKEPVVEARGFVDWNSYISRMFDAIPDGIQHLCKPCHDVKTAQERVARQRNKEAS